MVQALNVTLENSPWRLIRYIDQIKQVVAQLDQGQFLYIPREASEVARILAAFAFKRNIHQ